MIRETSRLSYIKGASLQTSVRATAHEDDDMPTAPAVNAQSNTARSRTWPSGGRPAARPAQAGDYGALRPADSERQHRPGADYVTIPVAAAMTGYSAKAIRRKIESGVWLEGREFRRAPDGHVLISVKGYELWVERGRA